MYDGAVVRNSCLFLLILGLFVPHALAAFAVCQAGWDWASNSKLQNPCEIAGALEAECRGFAAYILGPIGQGTNYVAPQKNSSAQKCECNTVMFSLYMACTACQGVSTETWTFWTKYCDQVYVTQYPETIPANTAVPNWAYSNYTNGDNFDRVVAQAAGPQPERLAPTPTTISGSSNSAISSSSSLISTAANSGPTGGGDQNGSIKKSPNIGAIVGGVVGGLVFFAAVCVGAWMLRRRRKAFGEEIGRDRPELFGPSVMTHESGARPPERLRLYDPSDPFTFPDKIDYGMSETYASSSSRPHYTGVAEL